MWAKGTRVIILNKDAVGNGGLIGVVTKCMTKMVEVTRRDSQGLVGTTRRYPDSLVRVEDGIVCRQDSAGLWSLVLEDGLPKTGLHANAGERGRVSDDDE
jgi:rhamnogalacturonyl hydrolase YesR